MQIGEFAILCNTKISVLRHYDREGLLKPDYTDSFTGYRYYTKEQVDVFFKISALKSAGFSLLQIKQIISEEKSKESILRLFDEKRHELKDSLHKLENVKNILFADHHSLGAEVMREGDGLYLRKACTSPEDFESICRDLELYISLESYQRISPFSIHAMQEGFSVECKIVNLSPKILSVINDPMPPFEDDPSVVGKWQAVGEFAVREDFFTSMNPKVQKKGRAIDLLYFLPGGENYWCFGWTRSKLIIDRVSGDRTVNDYTVETVGGQQYMFVDLKSYGYRRGGSTTVLVLRKLDGISYTKEDIAITDNIDLDFTDDRSIIGKWRSVGFVWDKDEFEPSQSPAAKLFWQTAEFFDEGRVVSTFTSGDVIDNEKMQTWTRGCIIRKWTKNTLGYEIRVIDNKEYLFIQWKSGDYIYGKMDTNYYVFERSE